MSERTYDCAVVGAGMVGATLALALDRAGLDSVVIERRPGGDQDGEVPDQRGLALSLSTQRLLANLDLWDAVAPLTVPIRHIELSEQGRYAFARLSADDIDAPALGYVCPAVSLARLLDAAAAGAQRVHMLRPAIIDSVETSAAGVHLALSDAPAAGATARLLVVSDGARSATRQRLGITASERDYGQTVIVGNVDIERPRPDTAFHRLGAAGPMVLLPLGGRRCVAIWTVPAADAEATLALADSAWCERFAAVFGSRLGRFSAPGPRSAHPVSLSSADRIAEGPAVLVGNAAQAVHPNGAQGLNLGLRDVACLLDCIAGTLGDSASQDMTDTMHGGGDAAARRCAERYAAARATDRRRVIRFTDAMARGGASGFLPLVAARDLALLT
ncbi:MAG: NAD(P)-binding protein, partial [Gammaproteobacteria bacterium]|nr:NAD(P)-binding protein [Gammaproteobacteria bacterium]